MDTPTEPQNAGGQPSTRSTVKQTVGLAILALALPLVLLLCIIAALIPAVPWWVGIPVGLGIAVGYVFLRLQRAVEILLNALGASPSSAHDRPRLHNIVEGLSLAGGVDEPELYVVEDDGHNMAAVAHGSRTAVVASTGLLGAFDRISLEGVVAEALVRIRSGDAEAATLGFALFGPLLSGPFAPLGRPVAAVGLQRLLPDDRDLTADRDAVGLTRYPPGLYSGLSTIRSGGAQIGRAAPAAEHVWLVPPSAAQMNEGSTNSSAVVDSAPLDLRIDVLGEL